MKLLEKTLRVMAFLSLTIVFMQCEKQELIDDASYNIGESTMLSMEAPNEESAGNNLSFPVIWSDGYALNLREAPLSGEVEIKGDWWYVWGIDPIDPQANLFSCYPSENDERLCSDGTRPGDGGGDVYKAYVQKDLLNGWQADNFMAYKPINIDLIDWGDNLESIDWSIRSQVRTEVVLYKNLDRPVTEYSMRHASGWGTDEVHGLQTDLKDQIVYGPGNQATIYSHNARLTIQKLNVKREDISESDLYWVPGRGWFERTKPNDIINEPIFNMAVYNAEDGPGYYQAEVNVKGKIIYGYTWNVRKLNDGAGDYRITFSFDKEGGIVGLNTFFDKYSDILLADEEEVVHKSGEDDRGGVAKIDLANNLSYMDIRILKKGGGSGGGHGN